MNGADTIAIVILAAIVIAVLAYLLHWLYRRSTKDVSFVRTGLGGEKVVMGGGAFVLPIVHDLTEVSMNTLRLEVQRMREKSLITKDRMRIELDVEFYVRVIPNEKDVATAARTLGNRTMNSDKLKELVQGRFVDAMGSVAASMTLEQMHEQRGDFIKAVKEAVAESLTPNGLELEAVSLTSLDQADMKLFNPSNAFDAEGLTRLTEEIELRKKKRNDIEQDTMIAIRNKNLEAEKIGSEHPARQRICPARPGERDRRAPSPAAGRGRAQENAAREREAEEARIKEREAVESGPYPHGAGDRGAGDQAHSGARDRGAGARDRHFHRSRRSAPKPNPRPRPRAPRWWRRRKRSSPSAIPRSPTARS